MSKGLAVFDHALRHATSSATPSARLYPALNAHHTLASHNRHPHHSNHPSPPPLPPQSIHYTSTRTLTTFPPLSSHENPLNLPRRSSSSSPPTNAPELARRAQRGLPPKRAIPSVAHTIAITSAKGGVGKSTLAANLALAFARHGHRAGILDTDIFGPSVPTLMGLSGRSANVDDAGKLIPLTSFGVKSMSMGYLMGEEQPVAWRGLMVMKALQQLLHEVAWDGLDVLVMDMPPGTGDTQLTIGQQVEMDGGVVVSTPQDVALKDAVRGKEMMGKVGMRVLGAVRNMSVFTCPGCGREERVFGGNNGGKGEEGGRERMGGMELLADLPLDRKICEDADRGMPTVAAEPESARAKAYLDLAQRIGKMVGLKPLEDS